MRKVSQKLLISLFVISFVVFVSNCGSGGGITSGGDSSLVKGQFIDDPVQGLNYACSSGATGVTNSNGEYTCSTGDDVTFSIGNTVIGSVPAQEGFITPYDLFPDNLEAALNLARLLQSLDVDPSAGIIVLDEALIALLPADLDFASVTFEEDVESALDVELVSAEEAQEQLNNAIINAGGDVPTPSPSPTPAPTPSPSPTPVPTPPPGNSDPIAHAGSDQFAINIRATVTLDGSGSSDPDNDTLTYQWTMTTKPTGSGATLSDAAVMQPTFIADKAGSYAISLVVNDSYVDSASDSVNIITVPSVPSTLKKTGQTTSFTDYDDGYYKIGVIPSYTRDAVNEIVRDTISGLEWQDNEEAKTAEKTHVAAVIYCNDLVLDGNDWRLPTRTELVQITDYGHNPAVDAVFVNIGPDFYWSSTVKATNQWWYWYVNHGGIGNQYTGHYNSTEANVRCVRQGS